MMFFKKKITVKDFCLPKCEFIFSENGKKLMDDFIHNCGDDKLLNIKSKDNYYRHFRAVYIELLDITVAKNCSWDILSDWTFFERDYLESKGYKDIPELIRMYTSIFGSFPGDGIKGIVLTFFEQISDLSLNSQCFKYYYDGLYSILSSQFSEIKKVKVIV
jgi:hypothetical protein